ncbi:MAG TPA: valine--tRNA ligase [Solirubrobacterales bacterium]|nr:valine--tRNA ligase [Solirubrobacterales bacterium]
MDADRKKSLEATTRWDPGAVERRIFERWMEGGWFHPPAEGSPEQNFSIAIPPPNVTGALHMGHALNGTIQDVLIRVNRMRGRNTLWVLGTDHAGIGTQAVVEKELAAEGTTRQEIGRDAFNERIWAWKAQYGSTIVEQFKRLGASCDYERERFTLDEGYVKAVYRVFTALHEKGWIFRDDYIVNWDPGMQSAISDLEIENREVTDTLYEIAYPLKNPRTGTGAAATEGGAELVVATVRPETMLADTAVAVNPNDGRYRDAVGKRAELPLVGRELPVIADEHVDVEFGTGALKITPGHDPNDFEIGQQHGLEVISVIGEDGRITDEAPERFRGMTTADAREAAVAELREQGLIRGEAPYTHSVPFSHRSGERVEPLISLQWFCRMDEMAKAAIDVVKEGRVRFVPEDPHTRVYLDWLRRIRPWCVSRQLWWGHRLPVWYRGDGEDLEVYVGEDPPEGDGWVQESDVLDTWFSSALWPFATLGWPDTEAPEYRAFFPTDVLSTARDIIFLWVARMIMSSLQFTGEIPFSVVNIHSVIQAPDGRRMSKSLGTGIDPLDEIEVHGADALRFGLLAMSSAQDVRYSEARVKQGRDLANKMWNASRLILMNAGDPDRERIDAAVRRIASGDAPAEDRWIASRLQRAIASVSDSIEDFDFSHAALGLYDFFWSELCDWYLEIVKERLYEGDEAASATLLWALERVLTLAHPLMPFVTEEIYGYLPAGESEALVVHPFPQADHALLDVDAEARIGAAIELTRALRRWRDLAGVAPGQVLDARTLGEAPHDLVARLARVSFAGDGRPIATVGGVELVETEGLDAAAVEGRVEERRAKLRAEVERGEKKLGNEGFVAKAPADVVDEERRKLEAYRSELEELG